MDHYSEEVQEVVYHPLEIQPKKNSFWRKLGGGSLTISIIVHAILLLVAAFLIIWTIPADPDPKKVDFMPSGGGGGNPASSQRSQKQTASMMKPNMARISVAGAASSITLPEMDASSQMSSLGSISSGAMSGGLGGSGAGGGRGDGLGRGFGSGTGPGAGLGSGTENPFGITDPNANALEGSFYNIARGRNGKQLSVDNPEQWKTVNDFVTGGWRESGFGQVLKSDRKLYNNRIYMAAMSASTAPSAFGEKPDAHPRWVVVYRGNVIAPFTGSFRFVGAGDDTMAVRFNGRNVFDYGFIAATAPHEGYMAKLKSTERLKGDYRNCPMEPPVTFYQYPQTENWNSQIGGVAVGPEIDVVAGKAYPIEILICEGWGGLFSGTLLFQQTGVTYQKAPTGAPILPLFRTDNVTPPVKGANCPVYDTAGPVWRIKKGATLGF
ncbi:MAG: hypothetical protein V4733_07800 [Verrucomicrobiota bacterium]